MYIAIKQWQLTYCYDECNRTHSITIFLRTYFENRINYAVAVAVAVAITVTNILFYYSLNEIGQFFYYILSVYFFIIDICIFTKAVTTKTFKYWTYPCDVTIQHIWHFMQHAIMLWNTGWVANSIEFEEALYIRSVPYCNWNSSWTGKFCLDISLRGKLSFAVNFYQSIILWMFKFSVLAIKQIRYIKVDIEAACIFAHWA